MLPLFVLFIAKSPREQVFDRVLGDWNCRVTDFDLSERSFEVSFRKVDDFVRVAFNNNSYSLVYDDKLSLVTNIGESLADAAIVRTVRTDNSTIILKGATYNNDIIAVTMFYTEINIVVFSDGKQMIIELNSKRNQDMYRDIIIGGLGITFVVCLCVALYKMGDIADVVTAPDEKKNQ